MLVRMHSSSHARRNVTSFPDYPVAIWATHRLGGVISFVCQFCIQGSYLRTVSGANPDFSADELFYQLEQTKASLIIAHPESVDIALAVARRANLPLHKVILFDTRQGRPGDILSVEALIQKGFQMEPTFIERTLKPGEAKTRLAFLSFSSGTTGRPEVTYYLTFLFKETDESSRLWLFPTMGS
ncbi:hypothetical protein H0H92_004425 [Tricholoma furcatifolium]|nr:hypothetical protein H0H92_004425 [Tricholoma furcatifolium]